MSVLRWLAHGRIRRIRHHIWQSVVVILRDSTGRLQEKDNQVTWAIWAGYSRRTHPAKLTVRHAPRAGCSSLMPRCTPLAPCRGNLARSRMSGPTMRIVVLVIEAKSPPWHIAPRPRCERSRCHRPVGEAQSWPSDAPLASSVGAACPLALCIGRSGSFLTRTN